MILVIKSEVMKIVDSVVKMRSDNSMPLDDGLDESND